jgi:hypothetical protein
VLTKRLVAILFPLIALLIVPAWASAEGWSMPNLNPWSKKKSKGMSDNDWAFTGQKPKTKFGQKQPSTWDKVSSGTAKTWDTTTDYINPWKKDKKPVRNTGARRPVNMPPKQASKSTWYNPASWWGSEKKPAPAPARTADRPAKSVSEFLNQPRVPY